MAARKPKKKPQKTRTPPTFPTPGGITRSAQPVMPRTRIGSEGDLEVHIPSLPTPERAMTADWVGADQHGRFVKIAFGQVQPEDAGKRDGVRLLAALVVTMPSRQIRKLEPAFLTKLRDYLKSVDASSEPLPRLAHAIYPPSRVVTEAATIMSMAHVGDEAELRFFRVSPEVIHQLRSQPTEEDLADAFEPVVRIFLTVDLLGSLVERMVALPASPEGNPT